MGFDSRNLWGSSENRRSKIEVSTKILNFLKRSKNFEWKFHPKVRKYIWKASWMLAKNFVASSGSLFQLKTWVLNESLQMHKKIRTDDSMYLGSFSENFSTILKNEDELHYFSPGLSLLMHRNKNHMDFYLQIKHILNHENTQTKRKSR